MRRAGKVNDVETSSESMQSVKRGDAPSMSARADQKLGASDREASDGSRSARATIQRWLCGCPLLT